MDGALHQRNLLLRAVERRGKRQLVVWLSDYVASLDALSAETKFNTDKVTRADLLMAIKEITLADTTLRYTYERKAK